MSANGPSDALLMLVFPPIEQVDKIKMIQDLVPFPNKRDDKWAWFSLSLFPLPPQSHLADALIAAETQAEARGRRARRRLVGGRPGA